MSRGTACDRADLRDSFTNLIDVRQGDTLIC